MDLLQQYLNLNVPYEEIGRRLGGRNPNQIAVKVFNMGLSERRHSYGKTPVQKTPVQMTPEPMRTCLDCREQFRPAYRGLFVCQKCKTTRRWMDG